MGKFDNFQFKLGIYVVTSYLSISDAHNIHSFLISVFDISSHMVL